jgi:ribosomal-protein-alanine N-acetyltransferase
MIRKDMPTVQAIESLAFPNPWSYDDFIRCLRRRNCIGMVAEHDGVVVGFMIYELHPNRLHVLNFAVLPSLARMGVGTAMMQKLIDKLHPKHRNRIMLEVRETNVAAQLFFKSLGFRAISVLRNFYYDSAEDAYLMQYRVLPPIVGKPVEYARRVEWGC